jgi:arginine deiminase
MTGLEGRMVHVTSEIGRLRRVLLHEPGPEVDRMVPEMMEDLLFDDILFGERAREEHARFRRLLQLLGIEVVEARGLLSEALRSPEARSWLLEVLRPDLPMAVIRRLEAMAPAELAVALVEGLACDDAGEAVELAELFSLPPIPNWCFQRDPQIVVGQGVVHSGMATEARWREGVLTRVIFGFHPMLEGVPVLADVLRPSCDGSRMLGLHRPRLEGGDVLVLSGDVVAVGLSERTNAQAAEVLIHGLARREDGPRWLELVQLPARRAYMHLDTVFTPADRGAALVFMPVMAGTGPEAARLLEVDLHAEDPKPVERGAVLPGLAARGIDLEPISCGGADPVARLREQWTDGANTLALAPGVITLYDRNVATADELARHGFCIVAAEDVLLGREEVALDDDARVCLLLASNEIARARGGPHCLSHPLVRDDP